MRKLTLAVIALSCTAWPALAQSGADTTQPPAVQAPPSEPAAPKTPDAPAKAPAAGESPRGDRFTFNRVDDGFLRLDKQTGEVAYCSPHALGWGCQAVPEDRAALDREIARLKDEVATLKAQLALMRAPSPPPRPPADLAPAPPPQAKAPPSAAGRDQDTAKLRDDLERARLAFENAWRKLVDMIVTLQRDLARKG
jgi:hypothetical protein